jgi:hypothetical protein
MIKKTSRLSAPKSRTRRAALLFATIYLLALGGTAQGDWYVLDRQVRDEVKGLRSDIKPQRTTASGGAFNPYTPRAKDYDLVADVTRDENYGMEARCGETKTFSGAELWKVPPLPAAGGVGGANLTQLNTEICQRMVAAENRRFQQVLNMMSRIKERNDKLKTMAENRSGIDSKGQIDVSTNNLQMSIADAQIEIQYMHATIAGYDSLIATLKQSQDSIADRTLNGKDDAAESVRRTALTAAIAAASII